MSKAFTRESDDAPDLPVLRPAAVLPPGAKNLMTPGGAARLRAELERLAREERPLFAESAGADHEAKQRLRALDQRMELLHQKLQSAVVTGPPVPPDDTVRFGATVLVRERNGAQTTYRIVGVDETDLDQNWVSWLSPIAKALLNAHVGQRVHFKFPAGEEELEILSVTYEWRCGDVSG